MNSIQPYKLALVSHPKQSMTAMFLEGFFHPMTMNQVFHTPSILQGGKTHDVNRLIDQFWRDDDHSIPIGNNDVFGLDDDFVASCCMYRDFPIDGRHLGERSLTERGVSFGKYLLAGGEGR